MKKTQYSSPVREEFRSQFVIANDELLIKSLGGPTKVAKLLGYDKFGGAQRVSNWMRRGIPAKVKLEHPNIFLNK